MKERSLFDKVIPLMLKKHRIHENDARKHTPLVLFESQKIQRIQEKYKKIIPEEYSSYFLERIDFTTKTNDDKIIRNLIIGMEEANV